MSDYLGLGAPKKRQREIKVYSHYLLPQLDIQLNKETGNTEIVETGTRDIYEEIQSCKDQAGFQSMYAQLQSGRAVPADFADDGKHSVDTSAAPDNINDAYRQTLAAEQAAAQAKAKLGLEGDIPADKIEEIVQAKVEEILKSYTDVKASQVKGDKKDETE